MPWQDKDAGRDKDRERDKPAADMLRRTLASRSDTEGTCPDPEILAAYVERSLDAEETARYELHFSQCARCREQLAAMAHAGEVAGGAAEKRPRASSTAWLWDWRWLAPATAVLVVAAVLVARRPSPPHSAGETSQPLVAMNQPASTPAAPTAATASEVEPGASASAPMASISKMRSAPILNSAKPEITPPAAPPPPLPGRNESDATTVLNSRNYEQLDTLKKSAAAPKPGVSSQSGNAIGYGVGSGAANGVGVAVPPPSTSESVTVATAAPTAGVPAAPPPPEKKSAQSNGAVSASDTVTKETASGQQLSMVVANRNLTATESVMVQANNATPAQTLVRSPDPQILWRFSAGRYVERSSDAGATWHVQWTNANAHLVAGVAPSSDSCWLVGRAGMVLVTADGKKWKQVAPPANADFVQVAATDASSATLTSADGRKFSTSDRGNHWSPAP